MANDTNNTGSGALTHDRVAGFRESFDSDPNKKLVQNVVTQHDVNDIAPVSYTHLTLPTILLV